MGYEEDQARRGKMKAYEEQDAANRPSRAHKLIEFIDRTNAFETLHEIDPRTVSFDQFESYLLRVNGIVRGLPMDKRSFDGQSVKLEGFLMGGVMPPRFEDKQGLLREAFESSKSLSQEDRAYLLSAVINSLHLFNDANGRTSRTNFLIQTATNKDQLYSELEKALGTEGRYETPDINPGQVDFEIQRYILQTEHGWSVGPGGQLNRHVALRGGIASADYSQIDRTDSKFVENIKKFKEISETDFYYIMTATVETLSPDQYHELLIRDKWLSPVKMASLSIEQWNDIFEAYYKLKRDHVETLIDSFVNPEKYPNPENPDETFKDMFKRRIKEELDRNKLK